MLTTTRMLSFKKKKN